MVERLLEEQLFTLDFILAVNPLLSDCVTDPNQRVEA